jgi:hypothetical protein
MKLHIPLCEFVFFISIAFAGIIAVSLSFGVRMGIVSSPVILGSFVVAALFAARRRAQDNRNKEEAEAKAVIGALAGTAGNIPIAKSLIRISDNNSHYAMAEKIRKVGRRLQLGEELGTAVREEGIVGTLGAALQNLAQDSRNGMDSASSLREVDRRLGYEMRLASEKKQGLMQRNLTLLMVVGTVVPSLFLFLFTGYAMVEGSAIVIVAFSVFMCGIIPAAYSIAGLGVGG